MDDAASAVRRSLGYSRIGTNIRRVVTDALDITVEREIMRESNGRYVGN